MVEKKMVLLLTLSYSSIGACEVVEPVHTEETEPQASVAKSPGARSLAVTVAVLERQAESAGASPAGDHHVTDKRVVDVVHDSSMDVESPGLVLSELFGSPKESWGLK
jgi:hypothetical protein